MNENINNPRETDRGDWLNIAESAVGNTSRVADAVAAAGLFTMMLLIVGNILLTKILKTPILGTYEYVGFIAATTISLALARCAFNSFHIAIGLVVDKLAEKKKAVAETVTRAFVLPFMILFTVRIFLYAGRMFQSGQVAPTTKVPIYPFIYIMGIGFALMSLVILWQLVSALVKAVHS